ncbi:MAG: hypothetical protein ICV76_00280 [Nitrospiraceae bacterium]|nr:hypothetical protein [Nitrospiraceae bacterium]
MANVKKRRTRTTGITNLPLKAEQENQDRVPPRGRSKKTQGASSTQRTDGRATASGSLSEKEKREIDSKGAKGGKTGGSRAGLISSNKKTNRT